MFLFGGIRDSVRIERVLRCAETSHYDYRDREFENSANRG